MSQNPLPTTLVQAVRYFSDPETCVQFFAQVRWPNGPICPSCGGTDHSYLKTRMVWKCKTKGCKRQFSVKVGTIFEDSPIKMKNWLVAVWLIANSKNGISSYELGRAVGLTQKSAWFVLQRIRLAMRTGTFQKLDGQVETDETYIGGKHKNMHKAERNRRIGHSDKTMVVGSLQRAMEDKPSRVIAEPVLDTKWHGPSTHVLETVEPGADLYTDAATMYMSLRKQYKHSTVDHSRGEYGRGSVTTNGIENFWSLLKRALNGTYISVDEQHLFRYVDERVFAFNLRYLTDLERFQAVLGQATDRRLTHADLTHKRAA